MSTYHVKLTPSLRTEGTEGGLDTSVVNGVSAQRSSYFEVYTTAKRKIVAKLDGVAFDDVIPVWSDNTNIITP